MTRPIIWLFDKADVLDWKGDLAASALVLIAVAALALPARLLLWMFA